MNLCYKENGLGMVIFILITCDKYEKIYKDERSGMKKRNLVFLIAMSMLALTSCDKFSSDVTTTTMVVPEESIVEETTLKSEVETTTEKLEQDDELNFMDWKGKREKSGKDILKNETGRRKNYYELNVDFDDKSSTLDIDQKLIYVNDSEDDLNEMYFNIIPNAYSKGYAYNKKKKSSEEI